MSIVPYGLAFADNSTDKMDFGSPAISDNLDPLTVVWWATWLSVANATRANWNKIGGTQGITCNRRAVDGTQLRFQLNRSVAVQQVDLTTGTLRAGVPMCLAAILGVSVTPSAYAAVNGAPLANVTSGAIAGSGTHDDSAGIWSIGPGATSTDGMTVWAWAVYSGALTLYQLAQAQAGILLPNGGRRAAPGCVAHYRPGLYGVGPVLDESGYGNPGVVTGAVVNGSAMVSGPDTPSLVSFLLPGVSC